MQKLALQVTPRALMSPKASRWSQFANQDLLNDVTAALTNKMTPAQAMQIAYQQAKQLAASDGTY